MCKLACPFQGSYRVVEVYPSGLDVRPVEKPGSQCIRVAMDRIRHCPQQIPETSEVKGQSSPATGEDQEEEQTMSVPKPPSGPGPPDSTVALEDEAECVGLSRELQHPVTDQDDVSTDSGVSKTWRGRLHPRHP